ncbi:hypothetical protein STEG23_024209, partial [Scotinomys teguina]
MELNDKTIVENCTVTVDLAGLQERPEQDLKVAFISAILKEHRKLSKSGVGEVGKKAELRVRRKLKTVLSRSVKSCVGILMGISMNPQIDF